MGSPSSRRWANLLASSFRLGDHLANYPATSDEAPHGRPKAKKVSAFRNFDLVPPRWRSLNKAFLVAVLGASILRFMAYELARAGSAKVIFGALSKPCFALNPSRSGVAQDAHDEAKLSTDPAANLKRYHLRSSKRI
ncbi:hypothetical protein L596_008310 [Steinernema carpocapsae]|uniref:Uncharacterized protein n=1 Tax=Steinernema carpocapsae TaxID=34508 RepID=A0A4U5PCM0_STECR|nr:hypothetical protein L596_008310 [Steinernema carpocapsae]